jgi:OOP family OmpA-OmpF porin
MPYVYAGAAYLYFDPNDLSGDPLLRNQQKRYSKHEWMLIGEAGFKFCVSDNVSLNIGFNIDYVDVDNLDDVVIGTDNDVFFTAFGGFSLLLFGIKDSDHDGVADEDDICPQTPVEVIVDQFGCPVDMDKDGVADYLDNCSGTPASIPVDKDGCPVDSDGDNIPDYLDLCKDTPEGISVDKRGCPFDEDSDGVPDYKDKCPGTHSGLEVNRWGCTPDDLNKELPEITSMILSSGVNFETGKAVLLSGAKTELNKMIEVMKKHPDSKWMISGYTDNTGSYQLNSKLSYERASSVALYLEQNGIDKSRLEVKGFGPNNPVADNNTESGKALNRRVEIDFIGNESLSFDISSNNLSYDNSTNNEYNIKAEKHIGNMIFTDGNKYCFQVASFRTFAEAERVAKRFIDKGANAFVIEANLPELDGIWYRVRIGYFESLSETKVAMDKNRR